MVLELLPCVPASQDVINEPLNRATAQVERLLAALRALCKVTMQPAGERQPKPEEDIVDVLLCSEEQGRVTTREDTHEAARTWKRARRNLDMGMQGQMRVSHNAGAVMINRGAHMQKLAVTAGRPQGGGWRALELQWQCPLGGRTAGSRRPC